MEGGVNSRVRSMEQALAELLSAYEKRPTPELARMIRRLEIEIAAKKGIREATGRARGGSAGYHSRDR